MGANCSCNRFMKVETMVSLTMFGVSIYMFFLAKYYYVRNDSTISLILLVLGMLFLKFSISTGVEVVYLWQALKKREEKTSPLKKVRFSSLLNVYEENDQSFEENDNGSNNFAGIGNSLSARETNSDEQTNQDVAEVNSTTRGLSPEIASLPSYDYWMSLIKEQQRKNARQSENKSFRERNCTWYENIDNSGTVKDVQILSDKDELFENDDNEEMII